MEAFDQNSNSTLRLFSVVSLFKSDQIQVTYQYSKELQQNYQDRFSIVLDKYFFVALSMDYERQEFKGLMGDLQYNNFEFSLPLSYQQIQLTEYFKVFFGLPDQKDLKLTDAITGEVRNWSFAVDFIDKPKLLALIGDVDVDVSIFLFDTPL